MKYNPEQIAALAQYANKFAIPTFTLHAYKASDVVVDEDGYTKAHNADIDEIEVTPGALGVGIETLLSDNPGTDVTISSKVLFSGNVSHIPMLDMLIPIAEDKDTQKVVQLSIDIDRFLERTEAGTQFGPATVYKSGNSFHLYGLATIPIFESKWHKVAAAVMVCDRNHIADHAWLGFCLSRGESRLRLTAVQAKYRQLPTLYWKLDDQIVF